MRQIGGKELLTVFAVLAVLGNLGSGLLYSSMPPFPTLAGLPLLVLAIAEVIMARGLRAWVQRRPGARPVKPLTAARALALAQASALAGAIMAGMWLGLLGYLLPRRDELAAAADDTPSAVVGVVCAAALAVAALWLQHCCRTPPEDDDPDRLRER
ncbi:MAG TPA: DUF3180 domain-containing protein [Pseudonocardia sp.]|nr:DUF3180 domain-containing protein [Pseudonocardia sp.]